MTATTTPATIVSADWEKLPNPEVRRVEMCCARKWVEARDAGLIALAGRDLKAYQRSRHDEQEWFAAMLVVNRVILGIEPTRGETFLDDGLKAEGSR